MNCSSPVEQKPSHLPMTRSSSVLPLRAAPAMNSTRIGSLCGGEDPVVSCVSLSGASMPTSLLATRTPIVACPPGFVKQRLTACALALRRPEAGPSGVTER